MKLIDKIPYYRYEAFCHPPGSQTASVAGYDFDTKLFYSRNGHIPSLNLEFRRLLGDSVPDRPPRVFRR